MARGRLGGLGLDPADAFGAGVVEAVDRADAGERDVARPEGVVLAVELALDLAGEEDVRLLERVVVRLGGAAELVVDGEHRHVVGAEDAVDQHLHRDAAVGEERRVGAGRGAAAGRILDPQRLELRRCPVVVADSRRVGSPNGGRARGGVHRGEVLGRLEERVAPAGVRRRAAAGS